MNLSTQLEFFAVAFVVLFMIIRNTLSESVSNRTNVALRKQISCLEDDWKSISTNQQISQVLDGKFGSCQNFTINKKLRLTISSENLKNLSVIDIHTQKNRHVNISVKFSEMSSSEQCHFKKTTVTDSLRRFVLNCLDSLRANLTDEIQITFTSSHPMELSLCEIIAISYSSRKCGTPEGSENCFYNISGNKIEYKPKPGYTMSQDHTIRYCKQGRWSGKVPACKSRLESGSKINSCGSPEIPANGKINATKETYSTGTTVKISCEDGFLLNGSDINRCNKGSWDDKQRYCDKNLMFNQKFSIERLSEKRVFCLKKFTDGNFSTSSNLILKKFKSIIINLSEKYNLEMFVLKMNINKHYNKLPKGHYISIDVEVGNQTRDLESDFQLCKKISYNSANWTDDTLKFICSGNPNVGDTIRISFTGNENSKELHLDLWEFQAITSDLVWQYPKQQCNNSVTIKGNCEVKQLVDSEGNPFLYFFPPPGYNISERRLIRCKQKEWEKTIPKCLLIQNDTDRTFFSQELDPERSLIIQYKKCIAVLSVCFAFLAVGIILYFIYATRKYCSEKLKRKKEKFNIGLNLNEIEEIDNDIYESTTSSNNQLTENKHNPLIS